MRGPDQSLLMFPVAPILGIECPALSSVAVLYLCALPLGSEFCALGSGLWDFGIWALPLLWALSSGLSSHPGTPASGLVVKVCSQDAAVLCHMLTNRTPAHHCPGPSLR